MTRQFKKNQLKQVETQSQSGRSMVEMLGVLAIIAILSIGGIVGYKLAMNYYQADQIANEINLMRNDLKVKYALGNEELLLGDPYDETPDDEHYRGHLSTQYDRYPVDYDCIIRGNKESKNELYNCREADAYYIVVGNISKGVCKPLTTLIAAMDGRLEMDINGTPYTGGDSCSSDEANEIYVEFDAEEVNGNYDSNRPEGWCAKDDDCEGLSTPVCDKESNTCVECVKEGDCSAPRSVCDVANHECVECIENADCPTNKPVCNIDLGNCESCPSTTPKWNGKECVECTEDNDCTDTPDTPKCNTGTNTCVECLNNQNCIEKDTNNPVCNSSTNTCEACPPKSVFYEGECRKYECRSNEDCADKGSGYYCYLYEGYRWDSEWENKPGTYFGGSCHKAETDKISGEITHYVKSKDIMTWWSAQRFCEALNMTPVSSSDIGCGDVEELSDCFSDMVIKLITDFGVDPYHGLWMEPIDDPTNEFYRAVRIISLYQNHGNIDPDNRANGDGTPNYGFCR